MHHRSDRRPESSTLMWSGKKKRSKPETPLQLKLNEDGGSSGPSKIEGTMVFKKVPTSGIVTFIFGSHGYSRLRLNFGSTATPGAPWQSYLMGIWSDQVLP